MDDIDTREKINIKMKDSGVDWIGKVPIEWSKYKLKYIANFLLGGTPENKEGINIEEKGYPWITAPNIKNNRFYIEEFTQYISEEIVKKNNIKIFPKNSILLVCIASIGKICMIQNEMYANQQITAIISKSNFNNRYILYSVYASLDKMIFDATSSNVVPILNTQYLSNMEYIIPLITEQQKIADFLDSKCQKIDDAIEKINKQIEVLKKYKQSLITGVVTKGLDKNVEMKESGVEWIERIPKNWERNRVKYLFSNVKGLPITKADLVEDGVPVLSYGQIHAKINSGVNITQDLIRCVDSYFEENYPSCAVFKNDFIFADTSEDYDGCGNCCYKRDDTKLFAGYHTIILHSICDKDNRYYAYLFKTNCWRKQLREVATGVKLFSIAQHTIMNSTIIVPPESEQIKISDFLDEKCEKIDNILDKKSKQIGILEQYKKSLIYEYVTGKKRV